MLRELGAPPAAHFLVQLRQLAAHHHGPLRVSARRAARASPPAAAATRTRRASRAAPPSSCQQLTAGARQEAHEQPALGGQARGDQRGHDALGPGSTSSARSAARHARTSAKPGSDTSGVPASETSATVARPANLPDQLTRPRAFVVLVQAHQPRARCRGGSSSTLVWRVSSHATTSASPELAAHAA